VASVEVFIDPGDERGLAEQVYAGVRAAIVDGRLVSGDVLTPSRTLAAQLGISRFTVTEAYARLAAEGFVDGRRRGGTVVTSAVAAPAPAGRAGRVMRPRTLVSSIWPYADPEPAVAPRFDLRAGNVDPGLFPLRAWRRCTTAAMQARPPNYGDPLGDPELRAALAHWIGRTRGVVCAPGDVLVTSGALHGLDLVARVMMEPGDVVAVEEPGYPPAADLVRAIGLTVVGVPVDEHGLVVDAIPPAARLVYVTPSHQFPLGMVLSHERRLALLRWAAAHDATIVEDDYDSQFRYASRPLEPVQRLDSDGRVVYLGTFSKVLSPSLRLGFAVAPPSIVPSLAALRRTVDWCPPWPSQAAFTRFIHDGYLDRHVVKATRRYRARRDQIIQRLAVAPVPVRPRSASAGLHITVLVAADDGDDDRALHDASAAEELVVGSLRRCYRFSRPPGGLLLGFGSVPDDEIGDLMDALDRMLMRLRGRRRRAYVS
jgi:GntR family transcriptional regulator / MocR family aminotransferase